MIAFARMAAVIVALTLVHLGQDSGKLQRLEQKFQEQTDPVHRAKDLAKLGSAEVRAAREEIQDGEIDQAIGRLERYRDEARNVQQALQSSGINAVKKPGGFQELQIALRESVRKLRDIIFSLPLERRGRFEVVSQDLDQVNNQLLQELFPPPPPPRPKKNKNKTIHGEGNHDYKG